MIVGLEVFVFLNLKYLPLPLTLPSMVTLSAPFSLIIPLETAPEINLSVAADDLIIIVKPPGASSTHWFKPFVPSSLKSDVMFTVTFPVTTLSLTNLKKPVAPVKVV